MIDVMSEVASHIDYVCNVCPSKYCVDCKISVRVEGKNIIVNGKTREIERVEDVVIYV